MERLTGQIAGAGITQSHRGTETHREARRSTAVSLHDSRACGWHVSGSIVARWMKLGQRTPGSLRRFLLRLRSFPLWRQCRRVFESGCDGGGGMCVPQAGPWEREDSSQKHRNLGLSRTGPSPPGPSPLCRGARGERRDLLAVG